MRDLTPLAYDVRATSAEQTEEIRQWEAKAFQPFLALTRTAAHFFSLDDEQIAKYSRDVQGKQFNVRARAIVLVLVLILLSFSLILFFFFCCLLTSGTGPCLFALQPDKTAPVGYKHDALVVTPYGLRVAQRTNGAGPGSGSKANSQQLLHDTFHLLVKVGSVLHADQFFGNEEYIKHAALHGFDAITIMTNAKAARDAAFRVVDGDATTLSNANISRADAEADMAAALKVPPDARDLSARLRKYLGEESPPKVHTKVLAVLKDLATTVLDGHKVQDVIDTWRQTPAAADEATRVESLTTLVRCGMGYTRGGDHFGRRRRLITRFARQLSAKFKAPELAHARKMFGFATSNGPNLGKDKAAKALAKDVLGIRNANATVISVDRYEAPMQASASGFMTVEGRGGPRQVAVHQVAVRSRATTRDDLASVKVFLLSGDGLFRVVKDVFVVEHMGRASYTGHLFLPWDDEPRADVPCDLRNREDCRSSLRMRLGENVVPGSYQQRNGSWFDARKGQFTGTTAEAFVKLVFAMDDTREPIAVNDNANPLQTRYTPTRVAALSPLDVAKTCRVREHERRNGDAMSAL